MTSQWRYQRASGGPVKSLCERVRQLREERGWPRGELAETFGVSTDYLLIGDALRRPFLSVEDALGDRLAELDGHDRELVLSFVDAFITKTRLEAEGIS